MEIRFNYDDEILGDIRQRTRISTAADIGREAMELYDWASDQVSRGRQVVSVDETGVHPHAAFNQGLRRITRRGE